MTKKTWRKPEFKRIEAGSAENGSINKASDASTKNNSGS
jgi:hypothetical protein